MTRTTITLPDLIDGKAQHRHLDWFLEVEGGTVNVAADDGCAGTAKLTPAEARAFAAALIAASYQAEQPTTLGDKGV